jgi:hypothetical protein
MSYWPEKETAVRAKLGPDGELIIINAFGLKSLYEGKISFNPKRDL